MDFLRSRSLRHLELEPERLHIANDGKALLLRVSNGSQHEYPIRKSFLFKLLKWFSFPLTQIHRLNVDTVTSVLNDYLLGIRSGEVTVTIEDGEALTITGNSYSRLTDLEVLDLCASLGVEHISRNDFFMRVYSEVTCKREIVKGDDCGFGYNILNSETGFRALSIHHYLLRYACSNGAIVRIGTERGERIHYGYRPDELKAWLADQMARSAEKRSQLIPSLEEKVSAPGDVDREKLSRELQAILGKEQGHRVLARLAEPSSWFEVFNVITNEAKRFDIGRRLQMETIAGELLEDQFATSGRALIHGMTFRPSGTL